jgi:hypothetical protein
MRTTVELVKEQISWRERERGRWVSKKTADKLAVVCSAEEMSFLHIVPLLWWLSFIPVVPSVFASQQR